MGEREYRRRWYLALACILALNLLGLHHVFFPSNDLWANFENHDTRIIAARIYETGPRLDWFWSEWPLQNGFYRPLPTLSFALDVHLFGLRLENYLVQTWLLAAICSFMVVWFGWEVTRSCRAAVGCGALFALWQSDFLLYVPAKPLLQVLAAAALVYGLVTRKSIVPTLLLAALLFGLSLEAVSPPGVDMWRESFGYRAMGWPPGRTTTLLTMFALPCIAAYLRWERNGGARWLVLSFLCLLPAFFTHEQVVVLAPCLIGTAIYLRTVGHRPRWLVPVAATALVGLYWVLHSIFVPMDTAYQSFHRQNEYDGLLAFMNWIFPGLREIRVMDVLVDQRQVVLAIVVATVAGALSHSASKLGPILVSGTRWQPAYYSLAAAVVAYAPLALAKPLFHYWYLPAALRTVFVWVLIEVGLKLWAELRQSARSAASENASTLIGSTRSL